MTQAPTYKAQAVERALRQRGYIGRDQTLRDWVAARQAEGHSVQQIASHVWVKTKGDLTVSDRSLRNWYPDLFPGRAKTPAVTIAGAPE